LAALDELTHPQTVERLLLGGNQLTDLKGLANLQSLLLVDVSSNQLTTCAGLESHPLLIDVFVKDNAINGDLGGEIDLLITLPLLRTLHLQGNPLEEVEMYRYRMLYRLRTMLDLDGKEILSEEKVSAQNAHGDNADFLEEVMQKYFPAGNPAEVELYAGEFADATAA
jgi:Leucine-rich repeat (LRR) protein